MVVILTESLVTFSCPELTYLNISNSILKAPNDLQVSYKLKRLILQDIMFEPSVLSTTLLLSLKLRRCHGTRGFHIHAPKLKRLTQADNDNLQLSSYMKICKDISYANVSLPNGAQHHGNDERITLKELLGCWPKLSRLSLNGVSLKYLSAGNVPGRLQNRLDHLKYLVLLDSSFDLNQIACILCLLQSAPNLHNLVIQVSSVETDDMKVLDYLGEHGHMKNNFKALHFFMVKHFKGFRAELLFIKLLLGFSSSLRQIFVEEDEKLDACTWLSMTKQLLELPRASSKAEILFQPEEALGRQ